MYLLDSNILISAFRTYYSPEIAPPFWEWLVDEHSKGNVASVSQVRDEIQSGRDPDWLDTWTRSLPESFWQEPLLEAQESYQQIFEWVGHQDRPYSPAALTEFFRVADSSLVAQAHAQGSTVVTDEASSPSSKKRVLIPDVCRGVSTDAIAPFAFYHRLGLKFS